MGKRSCQTLQSLQKSSTPNKSQKETLRKMKRVVVNGSVARWSSVTGGIVQTSVLGPVVFHIFITDSGSKCTLIKSADGAKLCGVASTLDGKDAIQRDLDRLERWACVKLIKFNQAVCKVLHLGQGNPRHQSSLGDERIKSSPAEKDLGLLLDERLDMTQQCAFETQKANCVLGRIKSTMASRLREGIVPLYSAPLRHYLKCCMQPWHLQHSEDMDL
ncbi:rna-directed dna polymerase from mobile element jockey-like [Pitangus sulphuratus]|nr:rna-directed dna polymerase from mobile element jockey-like [Pitangus sulphuratus]